jgi:hypothetical protein
VASFYVFAFVAALTAAFLAALWIFRTGRKTGRVIVAMYFIASSATLLLALIDIENVRMLGGPFTYQWLYYSEFLMSQRSKGCNYVWVPLAFGDACRSSGYHDVGYLICLIQHARLARFTYD